MKFLIIKLTTAQRTHSSKSSMQPGESYNETTRNSDSTTESQKRLHTGKTRLYSC